MERLRFSSLFFCLFVLVFSSSGFAAEEQGAREKTDQEKLEIVRKMFDSPYTEEMYYRTDRLLLTATGSLKPVKKAPAVASTITSDDIEKMGVMNLNEVLETVPGLHVGISPTNGMGPIYSIRGVHTSINPQVLVLVNGLPISFAYTGARFFFRMPVASISRIEIIRGPGSAVHGADAFAGTINIITKDGKEIQGVKAAAGGGTFDTKGAVAQVGDEYGGWDMAAIFQYQKSDGDKDRVLDTDTQTGVDAALGGFGVPPASLAGTKALDTSYEVYDLLLQVANDGFTGRFWMEVQNMGVGDGVTRITSEGGDIDVNQYLLDLNYSAKPVTDLELIFRMNAMYYKQDSLMQLFPANAVIPIDTEGNLFGSAGAPTMTAFPDGVWGEPVQKDWHAATEIAALYKGWVRQRWRTAVGYKYIREEHEEYKNFGPGVLDGAKNTGTSTGTLTDVSDTGDIYAPDKVRELIYLSVQDEWAFLKKWELTAGVRYDYYSDFGDTFNPRLALVWETTPDLITKVLYGRAFRPPSFTELYARNNPANQGNENLKPETIQTYELVFDYQPANRLRNVLNIFYYEIEDLIELDTDSSPNTARNTRDQTGYGVEFETAWDPLDSLIFDVNYAYQRSKDRATKALVADAPAHQVFAGVKWEFVKKWWAYSQFHYIGERKRASGDTREEIDDYELVHLGVYGKDIFKTLGVRFTVRNVFNEDAREPSLYSTASRSAAIQNDYPLEGRSVYGELSLKF